MSDSPIFDQMVREFQQRTGRKFADLCTPMKQTSIRTNPNYMPYTYAQDTTQPIPVVTSLGQRFAA